MVAEEFWLVAVAALGVADAVAVVCRGRRANAGEWVRAAAMTGALAGLVLSAPGMELPGLQMFASHMVQHLLLIVVVPVLLVLARPAVVSREKTSSGATTAAVFVLYALAIVGTHLTSAAGEVMASPAAGLLERASYLLIGVLYWRRVCDGAGCSLAVRCGLIVLAMPVDTFTGIALMMKKVSIGRSSLADVHLGGALMWFGGDGLMAVLLVAVFIAGSRAGDDTSLLGWYVTETRRRRLASFLPQGTSLLSTDEDAAALEAYNNYLTALAGQEATVRSRGT